MRQIPRGIGEGKNIILVVGDMLKSRIKKCKKNVGEMPRKFPLCIGRWQKEWQTV